VTRGDNDKSIVDNYPTDRIVTFMYFCFGISSLTSLRSFSKVTQQRLHISRSIFVAFPEDSHIYGNYILRVLLSSEYHQVRSIYEIYAHGLSRCNATTGFICLTMQGREAMNESRASNISMGKERESTRIRSEKLLEQSVTPKRRRAARCNKLRMQRATLWIISQICENA